MRIYYVFLLASLWILPSSAQALAAEARLALKTISERYAKLGNWKAEFVSETFSAGLGTSTQNPGVFFFTKPNRFRFSQGGSENTDFISNGKEVWIVRYPDGRKKPARVQHFKDIKSIELDRYLIILGGINTLSPEKEKLLLETFKISAKVSAAEIVLTLEPKKSSEISKVEISFLQNEVAPKKAVLTDALGNTTTLQLNKVEILKSMDPKIFRPDYPKGSKVQEM